MYKFIISESQLGDLKNQISIDDVKLPDFIINSINVGKTSLGKHPSFPSENGIEFEEKILKKRYYEVLTNIKKIEDVNGDLSKKHLIELLSLYINKCKKLEKPIQKDLETICLEYIYDYFGMSDSDVKITCSFVNEVTPKTPKTPILNEFEFEDSQHISNLDNEIKKRRMVNALIQGASVRFSSNYEKILSKIYALNPSLPELYFKINTINEYLSFVKEQIPTSNSIAGEVVVNIVSQPPIIKSYGVIFPTLLFETNRGVMELIASIGLPDYINDAEYVISQSDFLLAESWDKRLGVCLWDYIVDAVGINNSAILPIIFSHFVELPFDEFVIIFREIFSKTKKGKAYVQDLIKSIRVHSNFELIEKSFNKIDNDDSLFPDELICDVSETDTSSAGDYTYAAPLFGDEDTMNHKNLIRRSIQEHKDYYDFFDVDYVRDIIAEFLTDKENNINRKRWKTIPFVQYRNALVEFMRYDGRFMRFPTKYIEQWSNIITNNILSIQAITELAGHTTQFPFDDFCDYFDFEDDEREKYYGNFEMCSDYLGNLGFYDWAIFPDGSDAWSDYGLEPLYKLIMELEESETSEQKIVIINKILDVSHRRGDLASAFIEGGSSSLSKISYGN